MATSYQSHESSPINWGLLRSWLVGSENCQGHVPQGHERDPTMGHLMLQGSPNKWSLLRSCLVGSETCQGRVPQGHECSPNKWGLQMSQGSTLLQQMAAPSRVRPQQVGPAEVLPGRIPNLPGSQTSCVSQPSA